MCTVAPYVCDDCQRSTTGKCATHGPVFTFSPNTSTSGTITITAPPPQWPFVCPLCQGYGVWQVWKQECPTCKGERIVWGPPA